MHQQQSKEIDLAIENYLEEYRHTADFRDSEQSEDVVAQLRQHILESLSELDQPTLSDLDTVLDRLGSPWDIAHEHDAEASKSPSLPTTTVVLAILSTLALSLSPILPLVAIGLAVSALAAARFAYAHRQVSRSWRNGLYALNTASMVIVAIIALSLTSVTPHLIQSDPVTIASNS